MSTSKELVKLQKKLTGLSLEIARDFNINLDFSNNSIELVEKILGEIHDEYKKTRNAEGIHGIALEFAAYIITVVERNFELGEWQRDHPEFGKDSFPYYWKGATIFPYSWCLKRIIDGKADNVWSKYRIFILKETDSN